MSIRIRSLLSIGFALALLIAGLAGLSLLFSSYHYRQLEQETARHTPQAARGAEPSPWARRLPPPTAPPVA